MLGSGGFGGFGSWVLWRGRRILMWVIWFELQPLFGSFSCSSRPSSRAPHGHSLLLLEMRLEGTLGDSGGLSRALGPGDGVAVDLGTWWFGGVRGRLMELWEGREDWEPNWYFGYGGFRIVVVMRGGYERKFRFGRCGDVLVDELFG